jgi:hypothetical protein
MPRITPIYYGIEAWSPPLEGPQAALVYFGGGGHGKFYIVGKFSGRRRHGSQNSAVVGTRIVLPAPASPRQLLGSQDFREYTALLLYQISQINDVHQP